MFIAEFEYLNQLTQTGKACANKIVPDQITPQCVTRSNLISDYLLAFFSILFLDNWDGFHQLEDSILENQHLI